MHAGFDTLDDVLEICPAAEDAGADALLLSYPPTFYPRSDADIYDYSSAALKGTNLATVLFAVHQWNFGRVHPATSRRSSWPTWPSCRTPWRSSARWRGPATARSCQALMSSADKLSISDPREYNSPAWVKFFGMQWMGTSNFEAFGDCVPRYFALCSATSGTRRCACTGRSTRSA